MQKFNLLMQREMTRKEFLGTVGFGMATLLGFGSVLQLVGKNTAYRGASTIRSYGGGAYGGLRARRAQQVQSVAMR